MMPKDADCVYELLSTISFVFKLEYVCYQRSRRGAYVVGFDDKPDYTPGTGWTSQKGFVLEMRLSKCKADIFEQRLTETMLRFKVCDRDGRLDYAKCRWHMRHSNSDGVTEDNE